jgi:hypothetical protein
MSVPLVMVLAGVKRILPNCKRIYAGFAQGDRAQIAALAAEKFLSHGGIPSVWIDVAAYW